MTQGQYPSGGVSGGGSQTNWMDRLRQIKQQAEQDLPSGALTPAYKANRDEVLELLNRALAAEWGSFLQYWHHYTMAADIHSGGIRDIFKEHAEEEYDHAQKLNERINELGGVPANDPKKIDQLTASWVGFVEGHDLRSMLEADLIAERSVIQFYNDIIRVCGFDDNDTRFIVEQILVAENEHANDWSNLLYQFDASTGKQMQTLHQDLLQQAPQQRAAGI